MRDFDRRNALQPLYVGDQPQYRPVTYRLVRAGRRSTWRERVAILICQVGIPIGLVIGGLLSLGLMLAGTYLLFAVAVTVLRRLGGY